MKSVFFIFPQKCFLLVNNGSSTIVFAANLKYVPENKFSEGSGTPLKSRSNEKMFAGGMVKKMVFGFGRNQSACGLREGVETFCPRSLNCPAYLDENVYENLDDNVDENLNENVNEKKFEKVEKS